MAKKGTPKIEETVPGVPQGEFVEEFCTKPYYDEDGVQVASGIGLDGREYPDPVPMAPPVGFQQPPDLMTMIRTMVQHEEFKRIADQEGFDTFEEAGDFDVDYDMPDPLTPHEMLFYPPDERPKNGSPADAAPPVATAPPRAPEQTEGAVASPPPDKSAPSNSTST